MGAVMVGDLALVDLLLERNADPDATDAAGRSALLYATRLSFRRHPGATARRRSRPDCRRPKSRSARSSPTSAATATRPERSYQIVANPGRLLLIERGTDGLLFATELVPLSATRFYRANDPGAVIFEIRLEDGRVTGLAHTEYSGWATFPRLENDPSSEPSGATIGAARSRALAGRSE